MDTILDSLLTPQRVYVRKTSWELGNVNNIREHEHKNPNFLVRDVYFLFISRVLYDLCP